MYGRQLWQRTLRLVKLFCVVFFLFVLSNSTGEIYMALNSLVYSVSPQFMQKCNDILVFVCTLTQTSTVNVFAKKKERKKNP